MVNIFGIEIRFSFKDMETRVSPTLEGQKNVGIINFVYVHMKPYLTGRKKLP